MITSRIKSAARDVLVNGLAAARSRSTSRETFLAVSEYARRMQAPSQMEVGADLTPYELKVFSQNGEDGVLAEILRRTGIDHGSFVEFGAGDGLEANTIALADVRGWSGAFIEADPHRHTRLARKYSGLGRVTTHRITISPQDVNDALLGVGVDPEVDVMSIDVDGTDYWIWRALTAIRPKIVIVEYNSALGPSAALVQPQGRGDHWDGTDYFGASISALRELGSRKGYSLVHTEMTGTNAFFVRDDQAGRWPDPAAVPTRGPNFFLAGAAHPPDPKARPYEEPEPR